LYTPLLYHWAKRLGIPPGEAADFVQEVLLTLVEVLPKFRYQKDKRFRGWLWTVTVNKFRQKQRRHAAAPKEITSIGLDEMGTPDATGEAAEREYRSYLVHRALDLMQAEFSPQIWKACYEYVVVGRSPAEVAAALGLSVNAVYLAKSRVLRRLRQELAGLLD
jgi:RNA polymerase sigma-70 factor (ECF subfamily)